ncbi:50S ribosomal protein L15 [Candidatus Bathyarchaeota archaeon]|nr:50S ribosomal protein L15 [Candidatus Bathyarchaeota archaeon]
MPHSKRKVRKKRGSRTHGYGRVGQHRCGGGRGGRGNAGLQKHKWTYTVKYEPDYFGKHGFKSRREKANVINVGELDEKADLLLKEKKVVKDRDGILIDLAEFGYSKLLGRGQATHPFIVKVDSFTKSAEEKIKKAKGRIVKVENQSASRPQNKAI